MKVEHKDFPNDLKRKIENKTKQAVIIQFYGGGIITNKIFNLSMLEPYKIVFSCGNNHVVAFAIQKQINEYNSYDFFIGTIEKNSKCTMTSLLAFVNNSL